MPWSWLFSSPKLVKVSGNTMGVPPGQSIEVTFSTANIDHGGFFDPADPTRIKIPTLLGGWYILLCTIRWMVPEAIGVPLIVDSAQEMASYFYSFVQLNGVLLGNDARLTASRVTGAKGTWHVMATENSLAAGDELRLVLWHNYDPAYIAQIDAEYHLSLRRIEGVKVRVPAPPGRPTQEDEAISGSVAGRVSRLHKE